MPSARSEMPAVEIEGVIYVPGGFSGPLGTDTLESYNIAQNEWSDRAPMPAARHHLMAAAHGGALYAFGGSAPFGFGPTSTAWKYDPQTDTWHELPEMPEERMSGAAVTLGDSIYVVGGVGGSRQMMAFEPQARIWRLLPGPEQAREHTAAVAYRGELWVIGGRWSGDGELVSVEIFDAENQSWRPGPPLQIARAGFAAGTVGDQILVAGGEVILAGREALASLEIFDPDSGEWSAGPDLPAAVHGLDAVGYQGQFYLMGGSDRAAGLDNQGRVQIHAP